MTKHRLLRLCSALLVAASGSAMAQDRDSPIFYEAPPPRLYVGPIGGLNYNIHSGGFASFTRLQDNVACPQFESGSATGFYGGLSAEYLLGDPKESRFSIIARLAYDSRPAQFLETGDKYPTKAFDQNGNELIVESSTEHKAQIKYDLLNLDLLFKVMIGSTPLAVTAGPSIGYALTTSNEETYSILEPLNAQFIRNDQTPADRYRDNDRTIVFRPDAALDEKSAIRFGLKLGIQYEISFQKLFIVPTVFYDFGLTNVTTTDSWKVNAFQIGADVRFAL